MTKSQRRVYAAAWRKANRTSIRRYNERWRAEHREHIRARDNAPHPDYPGLTVKQVKHREYYLAHKKERKAYSQQYFKEHREYHRQQWRDHARRVRKGIHLQDRSIFVVVKPLRKRRA